MIQIFLRIEGIPGGSLDAHHQNWIEASAVHWAVAPATLISEGVFSPARFQDLTVVKSVDKSSPLLALACVSGQLVETVLIDFIGPGPDAVMRHRIRLSKAHVRTIKSRAISAVGDKSGTVSMREEAGFVFEKIEWEYQPGATDTWPVRAWYSVKDGLAG